MQLHIDPTDGVPIYRQVVEQVKYLVASGRLRPGDEVPSIRALAERLAVTPNTVARAYRELEAAGVVVKRRTAGTFVADAPSPFSGEERDRILAGRIDALLAEADALGVPFGRLQRLINERRDILKGGQP